MNWEGRVAGASDGQATGSNEASAATGESDEFVVVGNGLF